MFYFFLSILMYFICLIFLIWYFQKELNLISFMIILFNLNTSFFFLFLKYNAIYEIFLVFFSILIYRFIILLHKNNQDIILIHKGNIKFNEVIHHYGYHKLLLYLKIHKLSLDEIEYGVLHRQHLSIIKSEVNYPLSLIIDGKILEENLKLACKDRKWLENEMCKAKLSLSMINYAFYQKKKVYFVKD